MSYLFKNQFLMTTPECFESEARKVYSLVCSSRARMLRARVCGGISGRKKKHGGNFNGGKWLKKTFE